MATIPFHLINSYASGSPVSVKDLNRRANVTTAQLGGLLRIVGAGVSFADIYGAASLEVSISGSVVTVQDGAGFVADSIGNVYAFEFDTPQTLAAIGDDPFYVHAQFISPAADVDNPSTIPTDDTENTGKVLLVADASDTLSEAILLAEISGGVVADRRVPVRWDNIAADIAKIKQWLGYDDIVYGSKSDIEARLTALEGSGGGGSAITSLSQLMYDSPENTDNAIDVLLQLIAAAGANNGIIPSTAETDRVWTWLLNTRNIQGKENPALLKYSLGSGAQPGLFGTASAPSSELFDSGGTWTEDTLNRCWDNS